MFRPFAILAFCLFFLCAVDRSNAGGMFEDLLEGISNKWSEGVKSMQQGYEKAKQAFEESEARAWLIESVLPTIKKKFEEVKEWVHEKTTTVSVEGPQEKEKYKVIELDQK
ncbi:hypothetical protein niasHS_011224 [Heterodera schachtii]|uniref:Uncharacterized protein n=1 Tax=Heterodera schachtii TaxID=97005 RepID=A0ABD2ITW7_HETSC